MGHRVEAHKRLTIGLLHNGGASPLRAECPILDYLICRRNAEPPLLGTVSQVQPLTYSRFNLSVLADVDL